MVNRQQPVTPSGNFHKTRDVSRVTRPDAIRKRANAATRFAHAVIVRQSALAECLPPVPRYAADFAGSADICWSADVATKIHQTGKKTIFTIPLKVPGVLGITLRPRGGDWLDGDLRALAVSGIHVLVSLLESPEEEELGLEREAASCASNGLAFVNVPIPDLGVPADFPQFASVVVELGGRLRLGQRVAVHCRQSVGRSGLLAVSLAVVTGLDLPGAIEAVSTARGIRVPETAAQLAWLWQHQSQLSGLASS